MTVKLADLKSFLIWFLAATVGSFVIWLGFVFAAKALNVVQPTIVWSTGFVIGITTGIVVVYKNWAAAIGVLIVNLLAIFPLGLFATCYVIGRCL